MLIKTYVKLPIPIIAVEFTTLEDAKEISKWCNGIVVRKDNETVIEIETLEGIIVAKQGDYIIRGIKGEFYPCKPDIFINSYEEIE